MKLEEMTTEELLRITRGSAGEGSLCWEIARRLEESERKQFAPDGERWEDRAHRILGLLDEAYRKLESVILRELEVLSDETSYSKLDEEQTEEQQEPIDALYDSSGGTMSAEDVRNLVTVALPRGARHVMVEGRCYGIHFNKHESTCCLNAKCKNNHKPDPCAVCDSDPGPQPPPPPDSTVDIRKR